ATHVANIMAGSYGAYKGMAPGSDIVITTSELTDVGLLCGAEDILEYAKENGKRAVINMSMANYIGPHDGSALFSQYLGMIGEEAIVVLSAGNGGIKNFTLPFDFTDTARTASLAIYSTDWVQFDPYGATDVWSIDDSPLQVRFGIQDAQEQKIFKMFPSQELYEGNSFVVTSDPDRTPSTEKETVIYDADFAGIYSGWISLTGEIDSENGRYRVIMEYDAHTSLASSYGPWARYVPVIEVTGAPGTHADIYGDFQYTVFKAVPGGAEPSSILSFSDLASGENVISVGMYISRNQMPALSGEDYFNEHQPGTVSPYSSYSTLNDGRVMPHTVAPGFWIISAMSTPFHNAHPNGAEHINASTTAGGKEYIWATNSGTSMSAPYVAGTLACWLEALPDLTAKDIQQILSETNRHDYPEPENPRHGQGWFNPLEGLKNAIKAHSGISGVTDAGNGNADENRRFSFSGNTLSFWNPNCIETSLTISNSSGMVIFSQATASAQEEISLD
ncbi:MAG: S8 family serine peptidase, partial [Muribaculaceae bacterium]|nr:S8 family serine peptidase [Muribaculaceae bacterium]